MNQVKLKLASQIEIELDSYLTGVVSVGNNYDYSQAKLVRRISLFESKTYPKGKFDKQGNYKHWNDIITSRINSEVKNVDIDSKNFRAASDRPIDELPSIIVNLKMKSWMRANGQSEEINSSVEEGSGWGNVVWKKIKKSYERADLRNLYVINQTAKTLNESPVIERHQLSQSDLREKRETWEYVDEVIEYCKEKTYKSALENQEVETTVPYYDIYERNGEVCLKDLKEWTGETQQKGDEYKYVMAKVICAGAKGSTGGVQIKYVMFAEETKKKNKDIYKEFHRGPYKGRWFREGLFELLFDLQVRANQISNQISQGLELASKQVLASADKLVIQNILTDLRNGDVVKTQDLKQVDLRMHAFDQLIGDWNRTITMANEIANSTEVVMGNALPAGTPLGAYNAMNANANKLFVFLQEKLSIPFSEIFEQWLIPEMIDDLSAKEIINLTGSSGLLQRVKEIIVEDWYSNNLLTIGPHTPEIADLLKAQKMDELGKRPQILIAGLEDLLEDFKNNVYVDVAGEKSLITEDTQTLASVIGMISDPARRDGVVDQILRNKGIDVDALPRTQVQTQPPRTGSNPLAKPERPAGSLTRGSVPEEALV